MVAVVHYAVTDIHPFADGNGRAARLLQTSVLMSAGVLPGRMFSFEPYYAEDRGAYCAALRSVRKNTLNMEAWLEYFLAGLVEEYERIAATVTELSALLTAGGPEPLRLTAGQERALTARVQGRREFARRDYEAAAGVRRTAASEEISELIRHGVLVARGSGPATRYAFSTTLTAASKGARRPGRPPSWNDARIERELRKFLAGRTNWPKQGEFAAAAKGDLDAAASRFGGIARWRRVFGR